MMKVNLNPILIEFGPFRVSWYGLMYVFVFLASYLLVCYQLKKRILAFQNSRCMTSFLI